MRTLRWFGGLGFGGVMGLFPVWGWTQPAPPPAAEAPGVTYRIAASNSAVWVRLAPNASSLLSGLSHEHVIRAGEIRGRIRWDAETAKCQVQIDVPVNGLVVDEPDLRKRLGIEGALDEGDRKTVGEHMRDEDQLFATRFPRIRFRAGQCARKDGGVSVTGTLEIRGQKKALTVDLKLEETPTRLRAQGQFTLRHADFGFEPYSALLGTIKNDEALKFTFDVVAKTAR